MGDKLNGDLGVRAMGIAENPNAFTLLDFIGQIPYNQHGWKRAKVDFSSPKILSIALFSPIAIAFLG